MKKNLGIKAAALLLTGGLIAGGTVGGTLAWLATKSESVTNTFTVGDISLTLDESDELNLKMVPGATITKDPWVNVDSSSEPCWLFVKIDESENFDDYMGYEVASDWTAVSGTTNVYYIDTPTEGTNIKILAGDEITVKSTVSATMLETAETSKPTLTFTAYAVQRAGIDDVATAWTQAQDSANY